MAGEELNIAKSVTAGTTSAVLSQEMFSDQSVRTFFSIVNTSTGSETISLAFNQGAVSGSGIVIYPGGSYCESSDGLNDPTQKQINYVGSAATATFAYEERIMNRRF